MGTSPAAAVFPTCSTKRGELPSRGVEEAAAAPAATRPISVFMSEENDNQPPLQTDTPADRPRRPRRRFSRRHNGPRDRAPQEQRGDLNGPGERVESDESGGAPRVNEGDQRDESVRGEGG